MTEDQENQMTYDPEPEPETLEGEDLVSQAEEIQPEKKSGKKKRSKKKKEDFSKPEKKAPEKKDDDMVRLRALRNFMLWDKTMAREGEVVEVPKPYAERLLTHTPKAFVRA